MRVLLAHSLVAVSLFLGSACSVLAHDGQSPLVLSLQREKLSGTSAASKYRRRDGVHAPTSVTVYDNSTLYYADVTIGTLGQSFKLQVTCDASDTWVNAANSTFCQQNLEACQSSGIYTPSSSSTHKYVSGGFSNTYVDGNGVSGDWFTDTLVIGNTTVTDLQFGVAYNSTIPVGILGLGYIGLETYANPSQQQYPNLPVLMYNQSLIDCIAYSLWLDTGGTGQGRLIFGGLDTGKFLGPLETLHISMDNYGYRYATITMNGLSLSLNGKHVSVSNGPLQVSPDSGTTEIYLPNTTAYQIFANFGAVYQYGTFILDCSYKSNATTLDFLFGSTTISVPMDELITSYNSTLCYLNILPTYASLTLGLAFLRSAYIVYDFSNNQVSLAPTNPGSTTDNVTVIRPNGISGAGFVGTNASSTTSSTPSSITVPLASTSNTSPAGLTTGAKIGIGVGAPLGVIALLAVGAFFLLRRRRHLNTEVAPVSPFPTKSEPYSSHRTSELEASQRYASMSPNSFGWWHDYRPVQPGPNDFRSDQMSAREMEA